MREGGCGRKRREGKPRKKQNCMQPHVLFIASLQGGSYFTYAKAEKNEVREGELAF